LKKNETIENKFAILGLFISIIVGLLSYYGQSMIGFHDGHLTEYDRFYKNLLFPIYFGLNVLFFLVFILSLLLKKKAKLMLILYIIVLVIYQILLYYFSQNLENGQGG
jgi:uncharacterized protein YpmB